MNKVSVSIFLLFSLLLSSCKFTQKEEFPSFPDIGVASDALNKDLDMFLRPSWNTFKIGDDIAVSVHLKSDIQVRFDASFNARMYILVKQSQTWTEVPNFITTDAGGLSFGTNEIVLDKHLPDGSAFVHPIIEKQDEEVTLLIMIKGAVLENNQETNSIGSYIILTLKP